MINFEWWVRNETTCGIKVGDSVRRVFGDMKMGSVYQVSMISQDRTRIGFDGFEDLGPYANPANWERVE